MMKRSITFFLLLFLFLSLHSEPVSRQQAELAGLNFWKLHARGMITTDPAGATVIRSYTLPATGDPLYYIFDIAPKGFVIVAADDAVLPVLGYSFEDFYHPGNENEGFTHWMLTYENQIRYAREENLTAGDDAAAAWLYYLNPDNVNAGKGSVKGVNPLLTTRWDQGNGYNFHCPAHVSGPGGHCYAGCVATAMAQVMKFWNHPVSGYGSNSYYHPFYGTISEDFSTTSYDWTAMTSQLNGNSKEAISMLIYHCGVAVDMYYSPLGSSSSTYLSMLALKNHFNYRPAMRHLQKNSYTNYEWRGIIMDDLDDGRPVLYSGSGSGGGHEWVCDGYQDTSHFHMNWGWSGYNNGYFALTSLTSGSTNFNNGQSIIVNIAPYFAPYCSEGKVMTATMRDFGDGSGYSYYWNNTDCDWLIQPDNAINITLAFTRFYTEAGKDIVSIYDGASTSAPLIGSYSGNTLPPLITSSGGSLFIVFTSDASNQDLGWEATYITTVAGAEATEALSALLIYPNPAADFIHIVPEAAFQEEMNIRIFNTTGQEVLNERIAGGATSHSVNTRSLRSGLYYLGITGHSSSRVYKIAIEQP